MIDTLKQLRETTLEQLQNIQDASALEALRVKILGKKGEITAVLKSLGSLDPDARKEVGAAANVIKDEISAEITAAKSRIERIAMNAALVNETMDITLPGKRRSQGNLHPITQVMTHIEDLFINLGFTIAEGPFIETVYRNFDALNTPDNHPTREEADTFFIDHHTVLRTHTSPVQVRVMETQQPPIRVIAPGTCARRDEIDMTHTPVFHQMEGLVIDKGITFADLRGMLEIICHYVFGKDAGIRLRPSYFPFTEPSAEVDVSCYVCKGKIKDNCGVCKGTGWVELWGCGMVHPNVLCMSGIDPDVYSGYAFGLGISRITAAYFGLPSIKPYFENDMQFLTQFKGVR